MGLVPTFCFRPMYRQNRELLDLLEPAVERLGYELLGIELKTRGRDSLVRLYIDNESGISLADCERVSDQVTGVLDVHDPVQGTYTLEVSSPGLDRPLFTMEQIRRFLGHKVKLNLQQKMEGRRKLIGNVESVNADEVVLNVDGRLYVVTADNINMARLVPEGFN